jgi:lipopolysaccharide export system protein LptA
MLVPMRGRRSIVVFGLAAAGVLTPRALGAEPGKPDAPSVEIHAEHLDLDLAARSATMTGKVTISYKAADSASRSADKSALELRCPRVEVRYDDAQGKSDGPLRVTWVKGTGGVVATVKGVRAEAPDVELDLATQTMALKGGVRVTRGDGWIAAESATVNLTTSKISMTDVKGSLPVPEPKR